MKVYNKPISVVSIMDLDGNICPVKWKIEDKNGDFQTYKISHIMKSEKSRRAGKTTHNIVCITNINGKDKPCELRYIPEDTSWVLFKI